MEAASSLTLDARTVLFEAGKPIDAVYFPTDGVISLVTPLQDGAIVEVATIGNEGIVGVPLVPFSDRGVRAITQVAGQAFRLDAAVFLNGSSAVAPFGCWSIGIRRHCLDRSRNRLRVIGSTQAKSASAAGC